MVFQIPPDLNCPFEAVLTFGSTILSISATACTSPDLEAGWVLIKFAKAFLGGNSVGLFLFPSCNFPVAFKV